MKYIIKNVKDAQLYEIEYSNGDAFIEIPDEEIDEFIKKYLIEIANSPRLFGRYKRDFLDIFENVLQKYAEDQFYKQGKGEIIEDEKSEFPDVELSYDNLLVKSWLKTSSETEISPEEWDYNEEEIQYDYTADGEEVNEKLYEILVELKEFEGKEEKEILEYIKEHWDELVEKYEKELLEAFREEAADEAEIKLQSEE